MAPLRRMRINFVWPPFPTVFRMQLIYPQRGSRLPKLRYLYFTNSRKLLDWKEWIPRLPRTARQAGISSPGPWKERALTGWIQRIGP